MFVTKKKYNELLEKYELLEKHKKGLEKRNRKYRKKYVEPKQGKKTP